MGKSKRKLFMGYSLVMIKIQFWETSLEFYISHHLTRFKDHFSLMFWLGSYMKNYIRWELKIGKFSGLTINAKGWLMLSSIGPCKGCFIK